MLLIPPSTQNLIHGYPKFKFPYSLFQWSQPCQQYQQALSKPYPSSSRWCQNCARRWWRRGRRECAKKWRPTIAVHASQRQRPVALPIGEQTQHTHCKKWSSIWPLSVWVKQWKNWWWNSIPCSLLSPRFSLFPTLGYFPALGFLFFPPLAVIQP